VQAYADPLTGLANRLQFREHLASALQQESPSGPVASAGSATAASQAGDRRSWPSCSPTWTTSRA
jgi:hypothetical protein